LGVVAVVTAYRKRDFFFDENVGLFAGSRPDETKTQVKLPYLKFDRREYLDENAFKKRLSCKPSHPIQKQLTALLNAFIHDTDMLK